LEADISIWQGTGHFYFALTEKVPEFTEKRAPGEQGNLDPPGNIQERATTARFVENMEM
jgi:hypothetical protein